MPLTSDFCYSSLRRRNKKLSFPVPSSPPVYPKTAFFSVPNPLIWASASGWLLPITLWLRDSSIDLWQLLTDNLNQTANRGFQGLRPCYGDCCSPSSRSDFPCEAELSPSGLSCSVCPAPPLGFSLEADGLRPHRLFFTFFGGGGSQIRSLCPG